MRFVKKPVEVEAVQWDGTSPSTEVVVPWIVGNGGQARYLEESLTIRITTLEGDMDAQPGDWIIRGVQGEFYPCKPDIFTATYDPAPGDPKDER